MTNENIETIRNALGPKYEFPYYALVRVTPAHGPTFHIPAPFFNGPTNKPRSIWAGNLPIAPDKRNGEYYACPFCGEPSFYSGECHECHEGYEIWTDDENGGVPYRIGLKLPIEYRNHEALKSAMKEDFLRRLDTGVPDLGIISAEIVLSDEDENEYWNIPNKYGKPIGEIITEAWKCIDKFISTGQILPFEMHSNELMYFRGNREEFKKFESDLFNEIGFKFPLEYIVRPREGRKCNRCGNVGEVTTVENTHICLQCARKDPVGILKAHGVYEHGRFCTDSELIDPDCLENLTRYMEVPKDAYVELFENHVPSILIKIDEDNRRYFVLPPELANIPGYPPEA